MEAQIEFLGSNNAPPTADIEQAIKDQLLPTIIQEIHVIESQIIALENKMKQLRAQRDAKERSLQRYQSIISPIRRMAPEILADIFLRCLPTVRNPLVKTTECPLLLTQISSFWRAVAISESRLWARIYITFDEMESDFQTNRKDHRRKTKAMFWRRLNIVKKWLSRSGTRPLSIAIYIPDSIWPTNGNLHDKDHRVIVRLFEFLAQLSPRFKDLEVNMPSHLYRFLEESMMKVSSMETLTSLRMQFADECVYRSKPIVTLEAPNLRQVSISTEYGSYLGPSYGPGELRFVTPSSACVWSRFTDLSLHSPYSPRLLPMELIFILDNAPNLVHFKAVMDTSERLDYPLPLLPGARKRTPISLPFLRTFSITDKTNPVTMDDNLNLGLYNRIEAPGLIWVEYIGALGDDDDDDDDDTGGSIVALLERSPRLKKLTIDANKPWSRFQLQRVFRAVPSITHLFFGYEERSPSGLILRNSPRNPLLNSNPKLPPTETGLDALLDAQYEAQDSGSDSDVQSDSGTHDGPCVLPNLISLEISTPTWDISDRLLVQLITSRMKYSLPIHGSSNVQLEHVGILFHRQKKLEVGAIVQEYANRVGLEIVDLFLDYLDASTEYHLRMSRRRSCAPEIGLALDEFSWKHKDVEEFTGI